MAVQLKMHQLLLTHRKRRRALRRVGPCSLATFVRVVDEHGKTIGFRPPTTQLSTGDDMHNRWTAFRKAWRDAKKKQESTNAQ